MTTPLASQTHPSHTPSVSGPSLSPECPQVWTKDVDNIGDNAYNRVRFERSAHLSPSVDHLWTGWREPPPSRQPHLWTKSLSLGTNIRCSFPIPRPQAAIHSHAHSPSPTHHPASTGKFPVVHRIHIPDDADYFLSSINNYTTFTDASVDISPSLRQSPFVMGVFSRTHR